MTPELRACFFTALAAVWPVCAATETLTTGALHLQFRWSQSNCELYSPRFSPDGRQIALVRQQHTIDGGEAYSFSQAELERRREHARRFPRYADPEVVLLDPTTSAVTHIDWGRSPGFSPDGRHVVYAAQTVPLENQRELASTLAGNSIALYDIASGTTRTLATPVEGYFDSPQYSPDGSEIAFTLDDAVNGSMGGAVGVATVSLDGRRRVLLPPDNNSGFHARVRQVAWHRGRLVASVSKPAKASATYLASTYTPVLMELGDTTRTLFTWPEAEPLAAPVVFGTTPDCLLIWDGRWMELSDADQLTSVSPEYRPDEQAPPELSPDGRYDVVTVGNRWDRLPQHQVVVRDRRSGVPLWVWNHKGETATASWSTDSSRLAVVVTHRDGKLRDVFLHDELVVLRLPSETWDGRF